MKGKHADGIRRRRAAVLAATRATLVETGVTELSMRALAARAELSVATLYNLFGSKEAILLALLEAEFDGLTASLAVPKTSGVVEACRALVERSLNRLIRNAPLYRPLLGAIEAQGSTPQRSAMMERSATLIATAIQAGIERGELHGDVPSTVIAGHVMWGYVQAIRYWASGDLTHAGFRARTAFVLDVALLAVATGELRATLVSRLGSTGRNSSSHLRSWSSRSGVTLAKEISNVEV